jgi:hypothetical protein
LLKHLFCDAHVGSAPGTQQKNKRKSMLKARAGLHAQGDSALHAQARAQGVYDDLVELIQNAIAMSMCARGSHSFSAGERALQLVQKVLSTMHEGKIPSDELRKTRTIAPALARLGHAFNTLITIKRHGAKRRDAQVPNEQLAVLANYVTVKDRIHRAADVRGQLHHRMEQETLP